MSKYVIFLIKLILEKSSMVFPDGVNVAHKSMSKGSHHVWYVDF